MHQMGNTKNSPGGRISSRISGGFVCGAGAVYSDGGRLRRIRIARREATARAVRSAGFRGRKLPEYHIIAPRRRIVVSDQETPIQSAIHPAKTA